MDKVRVGLIGLGWMGQLHLRYLSEIEGCAIEAVCDVDEKKAEETAEKYGAKSFTDYHRLLAEAFIDTVYIVTPQMYHFEILKAAFGAGKHILCEKPLVLTKEELKEIRHLSRGYSGKVMVDFPQRFSVAAEEAMCEIKKGSLGNIQFMRGNFRFSMKQHASLHGEWVFDRKRGGGLILESSVHLWDAVRYMMGQEVVSVGAVAHCHPAMDFEDSFFCIANMSGGGIASIDMSGWLPDGSDTDKRFEIIGDTGSIYLDEFRNFLTVKSEKGVENNPGMITDGMTHKDVMWHSAVAGGVKRLDEYFMRCIRLDETPVIGIEDGARATEITWAVYEALRTGSIVKVNYGIV